MKWIYGGENGFWKSDCGRFEITPLYWGRVNPQEYEMKDKETGLLIKNESVRALKLLADYPANESRKWRF